MPIAAQFAYSLFGSASVWQQAAHSGSEGSAVEGGKHQPQGLPPRPRSALGLLDSAATRRPESERPSQAHKTTLASSSASIPDAMERRSGSVGRREQQHSASSPERASGAMRGGKGPSSASQRLQRTTASSSAAGHGKATTRSTLPESTSSLRIGSKNVFVSMVTAASSSSTSGHSSRRSEPTITARSTSRVQKQPAILSASSSNGHGGTFEYDKALPARPKSALSGLFGRRSSSSITGGSATGSNKHASKLAAPTPALTAASARVMPSAAGAAAAAEPKRPHTVLGGKLRGLTSLRSSSGSSSKHLSATTPSSSESASPAISPDASQVGLAGRARLGTSRLVSNGKTRMAPLTRLVPSSASTPNVPSAAAVNDQDNDQTIRRRTPLPLSRSGSSVTAEEISTSRASSSDAGHSAPGSPALSFVTRRKSLLEAVFEPYHSLSDNHHHSSTPASAKVSPLPTMAADVDLDHIAAPSAAAHRSMPGSPNAFTRAVSQMRRRGSSHRGSVIVLPSSESVLDLPAESALDDTASDAGQSGAHGSSSAGGHASPPASRRPSRRGSVNVTMRGFSFTKSLYAALDRNSAPTSPMLSATELGLMTPSSAADASSSSAGAAQQGFTKAAVHRASRSREVSAPVVLPTQSLEMDEPDDTLSISSSHHEHIQPEHVATSLSALGLVANPIEGAVAELEPMPPMRSSSRSVAGTIARRTTAQSHSGDLGDDNARPVLQIDTAFDSISRGPKTEDLLLSDRKPAFLTSSETERKFSQPTFSMADDVEFLKALEEVRRLHKQSISQQAQQVEGMEPISRINSSDYRAPQTQQQQDQTQQQSPSQSASASANVETSKQRQRADSASGRLGGLYAAQAQTRVTQAALDREQDVAGDENSRESDVPLQVGRAAGKMQDGAFDNDEDWKKEVKALFGESPLYTIGLDMRQTAERCLLVPQ